MATSCGSQQGRNEEFRLIRAFSNEAVDTESQAEDVVRAVRDHTNQEEQAEARRLRKYFNDVELSSAIDIDKLDVEASHLKAALETFEKTGTRSSWGLSNLKGVVRSEQDAWEHKPRWGSGKVQGGFHDVMGKINTHSSLLAMLPGEDKYFSVVVGAVKALTKASAEHRKTSEKLQRALVEINDEVEACATDCELTKSDMIKSAVAKLYIAVFLFYADAIEWYKSSSGRKILYSLHENFSDRFKEPLDNIKRLSALVSRAAKAGQGAETSYIRIGFEDLRAGLKGHERALQEERHRRKLLEAEQAEWRAERRLLLDTERNSNLQGDLWQRIGILGTSVLREEAREFVEEKSLPDEDTPPADRSDTDRGAMLLETTSDNTLSPAPGRPTKALDTAAVQRLSARLCDYISRGVPLPNVEPISNFMADRRVVIALEDWMLSSTSRMLCIEGPYSTTQDSEISQGAAQIVWNAIDIGLPIIAFFCSVDPEASNSSEEKASNGFLCIVYSLIHQLICLWPPILDNTPPLNLEEIASLDASDESWAPAIGLLRDLLQTAPPLLLCIIDGIQEFEDSSSSQAAELVSVLQSAMGGQDKVFKVLFTTSGFAPTLLPALDECAYERIEIPSSSSHLRPGMMSIRDTSLGPNI